MPERHSQPVAQNADEEFRVVHYSGLESQQAKAAISTQINEAINQTTDGANLLHESAERLGLTAQGRANQHIRQFGS